MLLIPQSAVTWLKKFFSGTLFDIVWKSLLLVGLAGVIYILIALGPFGAAVGGILLGTLISDEVRAIISDLWNRNFYTPAFALATLLVLATVSVPISSTSATASDVKTIDDNHPLTSESNIDEFESTGITNGSLVAPDMRLTVAEAYDDEDGLYGSPDYDPAFVYLGVQYNETIRRTLRFTIPSDYWYPSPQNIESVDGSTTAELRPTANGTKTVVTMRVDGPTDAVFPIPLAASAIYVTRDMGRSVTENLTGVQLPRTGSAEPWRYLEPNALAGSNSTVGIVVEDREYTMQYAPEGQEDRWLSIPSCDATIDGDAPVCTFQRTGDDSTVYILARESYDAETNPPPDIRYKFGSDTSVSVQSFLSGVETTVDNALAWVNGIIGGS